MKTEKIITDFSETLQIISTLIGKDSPETIINGQEICPGLGMELQANLLREISERYREGLLQVSVIGVTCKGKTTLVNALIGEELLPTEPDINSGAIVKIVHGQNTDEPMLVENGISRTVTLSEFLDSIVLKDEDRPSIIEDDPLPLPKRVRKIDYGILPHDNPLSQRGIILVDTLGFDGGVEAAAVTENFLSNSDAIIVVLGTTPPFTQVDIDLIRSQLRGLDILKFENIFFVINDFGLSPKQKAQLEKALPIRLSSVFFDDESLLSERVFIVNAHAALAAKSSGYMGEDLEKTGLPALEQSLNRVMDTGDRERILLQSAMCRVVLPVMFESKERIADIKALLDAENKNFEAIEKNFRSKKEELHQRAKGIQNNFRTNIESIVNKSTTYFRTLVEDDLRRWPDAWEEVKGGLKLGIWTLMASFFFSRKKKELQENLTMVITQYLQNIVNAWPEKLNEHVKSDIEDLAATLEADMEDFLIDIENFISLGGDELYDPQERRGRKIAQMVIGVFLLDPNQIFGTLLSDSWLSTIRRIIVDALAKLLMPFIAGSITAFFFSAPIGIITGIAVLIVEFILMHWHDRSLFERRIRDQIGEKIRESFDKAVPELQEEILRELRKHLEPWADRLLKVLESEIDAIDSQLQLAVEKRAKGETSLKAEHTRLDTLQTLLNDQLETLSEHVFGQVLTPEEQRKFIENPERSETEQPA